MFTYILLGALAGAFIGHLIPPGYFFWFIMGAASGFLAQKYCNRR
ncbi:hypothetical protein [Lucifera butyrica]|nr:hypothetical protein [Lucifera butyrica]